MGFSFHLGAHSIYETNGGYGLMYGLGDSFASVTSVPFRLILSF